METDTKGRQGVIYEPSLTPDTVDSPILPQGTHKRKYDFDRNPKGNTV